MAAPPRPFLTREQMSTMTEQEQLVAIAEWSSYNARLRREQEQQAARGAYRGGRARGARGRGRGRGYFAAYQPYPRPNFQDYTATFNDGVRTSKPVGTISVTGTPTEAVNQEEERPAQIGTPCPQFTSTGICSTTRRCPHVHDPDKTAICKAFLFKGSCPKGKSCPLSHEPSPNRSPHCSHFQDDRCNKDDCRYAHIHVNEDAPICEPFARLGYCEKGASCAERHAFECPAFANTGTCEDKSCRLPHVVHAGRLRKARMSSEVESAPGTPGSLGSDNGQRVEHEPSHDFTQQADYLPLGS